MSEDTAHIEEPSGKGTWCGEPAGGFRFLGLDHAAANNLGGYRLLPCAACVTKAVHALTHNSASSVDTIRRVWVNWRLVNERVSDKWRGDELPAEPFLVGGLPALRPEERELLWPFLKAARAVEEAAVRARGDRVQAGRCTPHVVR